MAGLDIIVIGASAGGLLPIQELLSLLPADLAASIFIVLHQQTLTWHQDFLPEVLGSRSKLVSETARDGVRFERGHICITPGDSHLLVERGLVRVERSPRENLSRPSIDALFRSAALSYGRRVASVLLSGMLSDGTVGLWQIRKRGGITFVQDPAEADDANWVGLQYAPQTELAGTRYTRSNGFAEVCRTVAVTHEISHEAPSTPQEWTIR